MSSGQKGLGLVLLIAFSLCATVTHLTGGPAMGDHECINAQAARQVLQTGQWLIPYVGEIPRVRKTPLNIWLIAAASRVFDDPTAPVPVSDFSARLPTALAGFGTTLVLFWLGRMMYGYVGGLMAGFIWAASVGTIIFSRFPRGDILLAFFTALAFACFWRGAMHTPRSKWFLAAFYVAFALAMMTKAPLPLAIVGVGLALYWLVTIPLLEAFEESPTTWLQRFQSFGEACWSQGKRIPALWIIPGTILFLVLAGAWPVYVLLHVSNALDLWRIEYVDLFRGELTDKREPAWYYLPIVVLFLTPYALSVFEAVAAPFLQRYRGQRQGLAFAFTWAVWGTFFLSLSALKRENYLLSVMPAYCLLLAPVIERLFVGTLYATARLVRVVCAAVPCALGAGFVVGGIFVHRGFPTLVSSYIVVALVVWAVWTSACWSFARGRRLASFAQVNLGVLVLLSLVWPIAGQHVRINADADALADALRKHGVTPRDEIIRVDGRPDSSIEFYHGFRVQRLINELEMAALRPIRREMPIDLYARFVQGIEEKLGQAHPVYLILSARNYELLMSNTKVRSLVLWRSSHAGARPGEGSVLVTQARPAATATSMPRPEL